MPRFSDSEKEAIKTKLLEEGGRLFNVYGIKKVSVDELVQAAGIAKGSFYSFYPSKEHLFMEIITAAQNKMWTDLDGFLRSNSGLPPRELMKQTFFRMLALSAEYPILQKMDGETTGYLFRKLPKELVEEHTRDDGRELLRLQKYGVRFNCDIPTAAKTMQTVAVSYFNLSQEDSATRMKVFNFILDGVVKEIVSQGGDSE